MGLPNIYRLADKLKEIQLEIDLARGENTVTITGDGSVRLRYFEEVL